MSFLQGSGIYCECELTDCNRREPLTDCGRMVAVMTMNVGYFMSILAGVFLGSVAFGRFMAHSGSH